MNNTSTVNADSSVGKVEDLLTQIKHLSASEQHLAILVKKYEDQLEYWYNTNELSDEDTKAVGELDTKVFQTELLLRAYTHARRDAMKILKNLATEKGNADNWCLLKHALTAEITAFEYWQADLDDAKAKLHFLTIERLTNQVIASFLGYEVTPCSACLADQLEHDGL